MAEKNIQIKNLTGDLLFPKTKGAVVINNAGDNLGAVEAGAQVNKLEGIKIDGVTLTITNKIAEYTTPTAAEYAIVKQDTAEEGYASTYYLAKDGVQAGAKINIAKDQVLQNVELKQCTVADQPIAGLEVGDYYFEFSFVNKSEKIYLAAKNLTDVYTAGAGLTLTNGQFAVNTADTAVVDAAPTENSTKLVQSGGVHTAINAVASDLADHEADAVAHITAAERTAWNGKQDAIADLATIRSNATAGKAAKDALDNGEYQTTLSATNKLDTDFIATDADARFVTDTEKATWNAKQDAITASAPLNADLVDDATATHKFVTAAEKAEIAKVANKANDSEVVHLAGAETITGAKTFSASPVVPTATAGDNSTKAASTAFVQGEIAGFLTYEELA